MKQFLDGKTEILTLDIELTGTRPLPNGVAIAFVGEASGGYFTGTVLPGGEDVQTKNASGTVSCCADYVVAGKDYTGADCQIHIVNSTPDGTHWTPRLQTDSRALDFLNHAQVEERIVFRGKGPFIRMFAKVKK